MNKNQHVHISHTSKTAKLARVEVAKQHREQYGDLEQVGETAIILLNGVWTAMRALCTPTLQGD